MVVVQTNPDGMLDPYEVQINISDGSDEHSAPSALLCIENTHNRCGGSVLSVEQVERLSSLAHSHGLMVHMDGARVFNAAIAIGVPASTLVRTVDSIMFCLSKGLSALCWWEVVILYIRHIVCVNCWEAECDRLVFSQPLALSP